MMKIVYRAPFFEFFFTLYTHVDVANIFVS